MIDIKLDIGSTCRTNRPVVSSNLSNDISFVMRKPAFGICENKDADQLRGYREADQRLFLALRIVQSFYFLNTAFQASSHLLWLYSSVCVGPGRKPRRPVFSQQGSYCLNYGLAGSEQFWSFTAYISTRSHKGMSLVVRKPVLGFSDQVPHKPGSTTTRDG